MKISADGNKATIASDLKEMMDGWDFIMAKAKEQYPGASPEKIYSLTARAMEYTLGLSRKSK